MTRRWRMRWILVMERDIISEVLRVQSQSNAELRDIHMSRQAIEFEVDSAWLVMSHHHMMKRKGIGVACVWVTRWGKGVGGFWRGDGKSGGSEHGGFEGKDVEGVMGKKREKSSGWDALGRWWRVVAGSLVLWRTACGGAMEKKEEEKEKLSCEGR
ncbi:hypothetical protein GOBAR_AA13809 [Gossypium barbadense]|uniref:Uncharacterized protein n=1 Tax=Gossypium barbadense TaxID=3634 RepID=A0A2P5XU03_GOSBA|nr:hypothetical protein GOBAR_AA13809 [Gossypium barbadense]